MKGVIRPWRRGFPSFIVDHVSLGAPIESIACRLAEGDDSRLRLFIVTDSEGIEEHRQGTLLDASTLAGKHGLALVPASGGWFRWIRDAGTWWVPEP